ncbi:MULTISPECIES: hypothetical protein [unclassified Streptomyces]|uniref:hypothetical protein n=1 Tax=unclassified Streptomyces TaxID=2593676 RepID=UPI0004C19233|nr:MULTISPECIES: hypothetical protein [unclassified Streptomyces]
MKDDELRARFDGRGVVEVRLDVSAGGRAEEVGHALGYTLIRRGKITRRLLELVFRRDDDPLARRRAEETVERLRAGGPVLPEGKQPTFPPPPPSPPPPLTLREPTPRPRRSLEPQPPPPAPSGPSGPRIPSRPPYPPPPPHPGTPPAGR